MALGAASGVGGAAVGLMPAFREWLPGLRRRLPGRAQRHPHLVLAGWVRCLAGLILQGDGWDRRLAGLVLWWDRRLAGLFFAWRHRHQPRRQGRRPRLEAGRWRQRPRTGRFDTMYETGGVAGRALKGRGKGSASAGWGELDQLRDIDRSPGSGTGGVGSSTGSSISSCEVSSSLLTGNSSMRWSKASSSSSCCRVGFNVPGERVETEVVMARPFPPREPHPLHKSKARNPKSAIKSTPGVRPPSVEGRPSLRIANFD